MTDFFEKEFEFTSSYNAEEGLIQKTKQLPAFNEHKEAVFLLIEKIIIPDNKYISIHILEKILKATPSPN